MASESVATCIDLVPDEAKPEKALTQWYDDVQWESLDGHLNPGVWRRLMTAKRSLYAANHIQAMLLADHFGKMDKEDNDAEFEGLNGCDVEALRIAAIELGERAEQYLTQVQDDDHGCVTGRTR